MVCGARSGSSSGRSSRGRGLFQASTAGHFSVSPPVAAGSGEFTPPHPRVPAAGHFSVSPPVAADAGPSSVSPPIATGSGQSTTSPHTVVGPVPEDAVSLQEGGGSFYDSTLREVWINGPTLWRERAPTWMRRDYWETLCNIWAAKRWQQTSTTMKVNRSANPEANMHTSGSISFVTHQSRLENELKRPPTFQEESYTQQMIEKYVGEEE
ncbi:hypothetical protein Taro_019891 [Colocasia esculenta]|uniref:Uncharacterized protein n=1 Tax=Colocasia esculenta TaxID=4460 RepID=A0A843UUZ8_COLES|nr:hypothetical protein [Colocasia esculenta]